VTTGQMATSSSERPGYSVVGNARRMIPAVVVEWPQSRVDACGR
jgi:hypothetical protein